MQRIVDLKRFGAYRLQNALDDDRVTLPARSGCSYQEECAPELEPQGRNINEHSERPRPSRDRNFLRSILNSVFIATLTVSFALFLAVTASYALARVRFRGRGLLLMMILAVSMFPQIAVLAGLFELIRFLGIFNTPWAMILSYTIFTLPFTVWVLTTFMRDLPVEIEEAAIVDGATPWIIITRVFLPLLWPALVTRGLLAFIGAWNEFLFALTFTSSETMRTTPVAIALLSGASQQEIPWGPIMAASVIVTIPLVILVLIFQRKIVASLTDGGVKG